MAKGEARCRGWLASGVMAYCDDAQAGRLLDQSSEGLRAFLSKPEPDQQDWIPIDWFVEALALADRETGAGDETLAWPIGEFLASREVGAVHELAARVLRPSLLISLAPGLWGAHFRDAGRVSTRANGDRAVAVRLVDVPNPQRLLCRAIGGWMEGFLRLGRRNAICVRHVACITEGASACEYAASWTE